MKSNYLIIALAIAVSIAAIAYIFFDKKNVDNTSRPEVRDGGAEIDPPQGASDVDNASLLGGDPADFSRVDFSAIASNNSNSSFDYFANSESVENSLQESSEKYSWSDKEYQSNASIWNAACESLQKLPIDLSTSELAVIDFGYVKTRQMTDFCKDFTIKQQLDVLDAAEELLDENGQGKLPNPNLGEEEREAALRSGNIEGALEITARQLETALERFDEAGVNNLLWFIAQNELVVPPINDTQVNSVPLYYNVIREASATLICQRLNGCGGENHPMVVRQCVNGANDRSASCYKPGNIYDAVYQTLTPLEFQAYNMLVSHVNGLLASKN